MAYDKTQQTRIDAGLCKDCGSPRNEDGTSVLCRSCASKASKRAIARTARVRKERLESGICLGCGHERDEKTVYCSQCKEKQKKYPVNTTKYTQNKRKRNQDAGTCKECGKPRYYESNYCRYHFMRNIAKAYRVPGSLYEELLQKLESDNSVCFYTGIPIIPGKNACVDHLYSRSQYPEKISDLDNLVWCDKWVNRMKGHMSYQDFISLCQTIVDRAKVTPSFMPAEKP